MKFYVSRTSIWNIAEKPPCEGAIWKEIPNNWDGGKWITEISTLEELIEFCEKYGKVIVFEPIKGENEIEIYDDWRE